MNQYDFIFTSSRFGAGPIQQNGRIIVVKLVEDSIYVNHDWHRGVYKQIHICFNNGNTFIIENKSQLESIYRLRMHIRNTKDCIDGIRKYCFKNLKMV